MESIVQGNIHRILHAVGWADQELREYRRDPAFRAEDRASDEQRITDHRERTIADAVNEIDKAERRVVSEYERWRTTRWDESAVMAAGPAVEKLLDHGGLQAVLEAPRLSRDMLEAARRSFAVRVATSGTSPESAERQIADAETSILKREVAFMGRDEARATEAHLEWEDTRPGIAALGKYLADVRGGRADAASMIEVGLALSSAGLPPSEPHETREQIADRERNSLPPEIRGKLEVNAGRRV
jgi:hypothetical protein